jgi:hypothetical protein
VEIDGVAWFLPEYISRHGLPAENSHTKLMLKLMQGAYYSGEGVKARQAG